MKFRRTRHFHRCFEDLPPEIQQRTKECFRLFSENPRFPFHPSLRIKLMKGHSGIWEGHVTEDYVFTFHKETDEETGEIIYWFRKIGTHSIYKNP